MSEDKRNFRVSYYDKVGFRGIGEKALSSILKDDVVDRKKLENFCIRYPVQASYRLLIWKILLDILPIHQQSHKFVMMQRREQYEDLKRALEVMRMIDDETNPSEVYLVMFLLEKGELCCGYTEEGWHDTFTAISSSVIDIVDSAVDCYWISAGLYQFFTKPNFHQIKPNFKEFEDVVVSILKKENSKLFAHLVELEFFSSQMLTHWHERCFAGVLQCEGCLEKIWDILLGGGCKLLPYVSTHLLLALERPLLQCNSLSQSDKLLTNAPFSEEISDYACHNGVDAWKKYENII